MSYAYANLILFHNETNEYKSFVAHLQQKENKDIISISCKFDDCRINKRRFDEVEKSVQKQKQKQKQTS